MAITLSGRLTDPFGNALENAGVRFRAARTSSQVLAGYSAETSTDSNGDYSINVEFATYHIEARQTPRGPWATIARNIPVSVETTSTDINALIVAYVGAGDATPEIVLEIEAIAATATTAAAAAEASAQEAAAAAASASSRGLWVTSKAGLSGLNTNGISNGAQCYLTEDGKSGSFAWRSGDMSVDVASDPAGGVYVPPSSDSSGASGAWERLIDGEVLATWFGLVADGADPQTESAQAMLSFGLPRGLVCALPAGDIIIDDTLVVSGSNQNLVKGAGYQSTLIIFRNATQDKELFLFDDDSAYSHVYALRAVDEAPGTSAFLKITSSLSVGSPNWKNKLSDFRVSDFGIGAITTTDDPLSGLTHAWASETLFTYGKFRNCRTTFVNQNSQAVNTNFISTDIENDDDGETYTLIRDEAGGGIRLFGCSVIGRGELYSYSYPVGGSSLWSAGSFSVEDCRLEARSGHVGQIFKQDFDGLITNSMFCNINVDNLQVNSFGAEIDLLYYVGRTNAVFSGVNPLSGTLNIRQFPTQSATATTAGGSFGSVQVTDSGRVEFIREESTANGSTYNEDMTGLVSITSPSAYTNTSIQTDSNGFISCRNAGVTQLPPNLIAGSFEQSLIYHRQRTTTGFSDIKLRLPDNAYPLKLFAFKQPQRYFENMSLNLYIVKDEADWASTAFDVSTDAVLVAQLGATSNMAGYLEANVNLGSNVFGVSLQAGSTSWEEGRLYIEHVGSSNWAGWVGVKYI